MQLRPLHPHFAAEVEGVDLRGPLPPERIAAIDRAMDRHAVLVFHGQPMSQTQQVEMAERFGPLDTRFKAARKGTYPDRMERFEVMDISNLDAGGRPVPRDDRKVVGNIANRLWHSDSSFQRPAARYSMLSAVTLPSWGGETEFCDLRAAYDALPQRTRAELEELETEHFFLHSRAMLGDDGYTEEQRNAMPPVAWPLVRTQAATGRRFLFIGAHARRVLGMGVAEGRMLLMDLLEHATRPEFVYRHEWRVGDIVFWDNRTTLHRGRRSDPKEARELRRTTTLDVEPALDGAA